MKTLQIFILTMALTTSLMANKNPLLEQWKTPYNTPPFQSIHIEDYEPAIDYAMNVAKENVKKITDSKALPTFENTILAYENSSILLEYIASIMFDLNECNTSPELQQVVMNVSPKLTRLQSEISTKALFNRVKTLYGKKTELKLNPEQLMLLEKTYIALSRSEAGLSDTDAKKCTQINEELGLLSLQFNQNVLADNNNWYLQVTDEARLKGLPATQKEAAVEAAKKRNLTGWVFTLDMPSYLPFLQYCADRDYRKQMWTAYNSRGDRDNANDNKEIIKRIVSLRLELARLFGFNTYADLKLSQRMAENPATVNQFIDQLAQYALPAAQEEVKAIQDYAVSKGMTDEIQSWDFTYYSNQLKEEKYSLDQEALRPYFELTNVKNGIFLLFEKLYGLAIVPSKSIPVYHSDVTAYEVFDNNICIGILYLDFFPRESKRGGAWMVPFRAQYKENGKNIVPLIQIVCNFTKPTEQTPALLSFDEFKTFLHEFGHAIHGLLSNVSYQSLSGTAVYRDFVELPSQMMENWATEREFLDLFVKHYKTGEKIPQSMIDNIIAAQEFNAGYYCVRQLALGSIDLAWHSISDTVSGSIDDFEQKAASRFTLLPWVKGTSTSTAFSHIFSGGYATGYYGYKWAEVLDADAFEEFKREGIFNKKTAEKFRNEILSKGGTEHPMQLYMNFKGEKPNVDPLLKRSGFKK